MSGVRLIHCEPAGRWAAVLREALGDQSSLVTETRSLSQCEEALDAAQASVVAVETAPDNVEATIAFFLRAARFPQVRLVALASPDFSAELLLREAGAIDVLATVADAPRLARLVLGQQKLQPQQAPTLQAFIAQRLPWPARASAPT